MGLREQFEVARQHASGSLLAMEGMRGFAVFLVFVVHYASLMEPWIAQDGAAMQLKEWLHAMGNGGVDLFFVLSGYLIYGTLIAREQAFLPFMGRRIRRIYPTFTVVFAIYLLLSWLFPADSKIPHDHPLQYLLMNYLLLPGLFDIQPMITVAWSLSYELFYYLVMPLLIAALGMRRWSVEGRVALTGAIALLTSLYCALYGGPLRLIMFMAGMLLFDAIGSRKVRAPGSAIGVSALVLALWVSALPISGKLKTAVLFAAFLVFCLSSFLRPAGALSRALSWSPLRWLGNMSYSYYLLHGLALKMAFTLLGKAWPALGGHHGIGLFLLLMPLMFALTLLPSAVLFLCIERPFSLRDGGARKAPAAPLATVADTRP